MLLLRRKLIYYQRSKNVFHELQNLIDTKMDQDLLHGFTI